MNAAVEAVRRHSAELDALFVRGEQLKSAVRKAILDLPDNPAVKRVGPDSRCFTLSSKAVFGDPKGNPTMRLDPFYHDFKAQYEVIAQAVASCEQANVLKTVTAIAETGKLKKAGDNYYRFNPAVVNRLRELLGMPADFSLGHKPDAEG